MREGGPSPIVPLLMVAGLGMFICWPIFTSFLESSMVFYLGVTGADDSGSASFLLVFLATLLLLIVHLLSSLLPTLSSFSSAAAHHEPSSSGSELDGFGFGTFLMFMLFIVTYNLV